MADNKNDANNGNGKQKEKLSVKIGKVFAKPKVRRVFKFVAYAFGITGAGMGMFAGAAEIERRKNKEYYEITRKEETPTTEDVANAFDTAFETAKTCPEVEVGEF